MFGLRKGEGAGAEAAAEPGQTRGASAAALRMRLEGARALPKVSGESRLPGHVNYLAGGDASKRRTNVPLFGSVRYAGVYPGVDLVYYGSGPLVEYDFRLAPGADPSGITMAFDGADGIEVDATGDLVLRVAGEEVRQRRPFIYQESAGARAEVAGDYVLKGRGRVGFRVGAYDRSRPLVIDPVLDFAGYTLSANKIETDAAGNVYLTSNTSLMDLPTTPGAFQPNNRSGFYQSLPTFRRPDIYLRKLAPDSSGRLQLVYATYIGGFGDETGSVVVDRAGNVYVAGTTHSPDFPVTADAMQRQLNRGTPDNTGAGTCCLDVPPSDGFVMQFGPRGDLLYSTYYGGSRSDGVGGPLLDGHGNLYVVGTTRSGDFPLTPGESQTAGPIFVMKFGREGGRTELLYSTRFGGGLDGVTSVTDAAVDPAGAVYFVGNTNATNYPTTDNAFQRSLVRQLDTSIPTTAYVTKLVPSAGGAARPAYSTYLGGIGSWARAVAVGPGGHIYVAGKSLNPAPCRPVSECDYPATAGAMQESRKGGDEGFVARLDPSPPAGSSSLVYSTFLGGSADDDIFDLTVDPAGGALVVGRTFSADFPVTASAFQTTFGGGTTNDLSAPGGDGFVAKLDAAGASLVYFTYLGGAAGDSAEVIGRDTAGGVYVSGWSFSRNFPVTDGSTNADNAMAGFLVKLTTYPLNVGARVDSAHAVDRLDDAANFVRQHYLDFLGREPDPAGRDFWVREVSVCGGGDAAYLEEKRVNVSAAYFLSVEFQQTGYFVYRLHRASYGEMPSYEEFMPQQRQVGRGVVVLQPGWEQTLEENKRAFVRAWVGGERFRAAYPAALSPSEFVDKLLASAGVAPASVNRDRLVADLEASGNSAQGREEALRRVAESTALDRREKNSAFVLTQYFGYLRRNPDREGFDFWLRKLDEHGGDFKSAEMVRAF
ncbi:MAG TPA: SBBP repeat-containing protein, partial [Acidimicrobiales bacterium]